MDSNSVSSFYADAMHKIATTFEGRHMSGDNIRMELESFGIRPSHFNQWGQLIRQAVRSKHLKPTNNCVNAVRPEARRRKVRVYFVG